MSVEKKLTFFKNPILCSTYSYYQICSYLERYSLWKWLFGTLLMFGGLMFGTIYRPEFLENWMFLIDTVQFVVWWFGLGVLSSIGLGTGLQTGTLYLIPYLILAVNMMSSGHQFPFTQMTWWRTVPENLLESEKDIDFYDIYRTVLPATIIWGIGTAVGEVPPFLMSAYLKDEFNTGILLRFKKCVNTMIRAMGFFGVFLLACYPNATFDMCGICCGMIGMSLIKFLSATILGKACVKAPAQAYVVVSLSYEPQRILEYLPEWMAERLVAIVEGTEGNGFGYLNVLVMVVTLWFVKTVLEQLANQWKKKNS